MIVVNRYNGGISVKGHAHYDEPGKDVVCAAVSTLAQVLIASIETLTTDEIQYVMQPGTVDIKFGDLSEAATLLIDSFFIGCEMVSKSYPDNVVVE